MSGAALAFGCFNFYQILRSSAFNLNTAILVQGVPKKNPLQNIQFVCSEFIYLEAVFSVFVMQGCIYKIFTSHARFQIVLIIEYGFTRCGFDATDF